jgi:hypothetical protein
LEKNMTFILQEGTPDNKFGWPEHRVFLDEELHKGCKPIAEYYAATWQAAREQVPG